jgi:magnesium transporter
MILVCLTQETLQIQEINADNHALLKDAIWIDLISPSKEEEKLVEKYFKQNIPTREEMDEIELSSRLYKEGGTLFMTAAMLAQADSPKPQLDPVTFVLTQQQLITIRYIEPRAFKLVVAHFNKLDDAPHDAVTLFIELLDATVDRLADILEVVGRRMDDYSKTIFQSDNVGEKLDYRLLMQQMGANADLNTKVCESLVTFNRLIPFFSQMAGSRINDERLQRLGTLGKDINSLSDHAIFLSSKVNFLLDATLGMVNIEQNNIIKIFSVAAVIFLPPTLVASIYGMNFHIMPELEWHYGYVYALGMILLAAWLPYKYFKHKKWL